jgi:hypothetical protein
VAHIGRDEISVVLPANFGAGTLSVVLFAEHDSESFVSNALSPAVP